MQIRVRIDADKQKQQELGFIEMERPAWRPLREPREELRKLHKRRLLEWRRLGILRRRRAGE